MNTASDESDYVMTETNNSTFAEDRTHFFPLDNHSLKPCPSGTYAHQ